MARKVRDSNLETRTARQRLRASAKPSFRLIEPGLHLGYRRRARGPGSWVVRRYVGDGRYTVHNLTTAEDKPIVADDFSEPDGAAVRASLKRKSGPSSSGPLLRNETAPTR